MLMSSLIPNTFITITWSFVNSVLNGFLLPMWTYLPNSIISSTTSCTLRLFRSSKERITRLNSIFIARATNTFPSMMNSNSPYACRDPPVFFTAMKLICGPEADGVGGSLRGEISSWNPITKSLPERPSSTLESFFKLSQHTTSSDNLRARLRMT